MSSLAKEAVENTEKTGIIKYGSEQHLAVLLFFSFCRFWMKFGSDHGVTCSAS